MSVHAGALQCVSSGRERTGEGRDAPRHRVQARRLATWAGLVLMVLGSGCSQLPPSVTGKVPIDLLAMIDLDKDQVKGKWTKDDSGLHTTATSFGAVTIPYLPGEEYDVTCVCQRSGNVDMIALGLVKGSVPFVVGIDGTVNVTGSGLDRLDGKSFIDNETTKKQTTLDNTKSSTIIVAVRNVSLVVTVDGNTLIEWKIKDKDGKDTGKPLDYSRLSLFPEWKVPAGKSMFIGAFSEYAITSLQVTPVTKAGKFLR